MAWINTDWEKELAQVEGRINIILDEKVEPLLERMVNKASDEITTVVAKAEYELEESTNKFFIELTEQRKQLVADMKSIIRYAAAAIFLVVLASVAVIKLMGGW
jgi:thymidylate kinase